MREQGISDEQIAGSLYGKETSDSNYNQLYNDLGYSSGEFGKYQTQWDALVQFQEAEKQRIVEHYALLGDLALQSADAQNEIFRMQMRTRISQAGVGFDALGSLAKQFYDASDGQNKTALRAYQAMMVGKAIVNTYTAASNAYANAGNPYLGTAMAALAIAQGMAQVAQIKAQKFHTGGEIGGMTLARDEVPAILQTGEYVLNRRQVNDLKDNAQNSANSGDGGGANVVIINSVDSSIMEQWANSRSGAKVIKNVISA